MTDDPVRVFLVDDHALFRSGVRAELDRSVPDVTVVGEAGSVDEVSVYVEAEEDAVHVFVRDRGVGFDPEAVPDDRHGLADSVHARVTRHGGNVRLRSTPGEGTEVHLSMPVSTPQEASP